jgi:hypothetical protein
VPAAWLTKGNAARCTRAPGGEPVDDPQVIAIAEAAKEVDEKHWAWLDPPGATETDWSEAQLT